MSLGNTFGLLPTGFVRKSSDDIDADLDAALKQAFGNSINTSPQSRFGQIKGIMAERYDELWALAEAVHAAFNPDAATGSDLVNVAAITGTLPFVPTDSVVTETMTGTPGTVLASGRQVAVVGTGSIFQTSSPGTITALTAWAGSTSYTVGQRRTNGGNVYQCITAGMSAASGGPSGTGSNITDGGAHWEFLGVGTGAMDIPMVALQTGPVIAAAGTLTSIQTPVSGWNNAVNLLDASLGVQIETDSTFRLRRESELHGGGKAAVEAIRAALLKVVGVTSCVVFENVTDATNSDGMPPHSVEVMCVGGDPTAIATAIFQNVAAGIATTGNQSPVAVTDSQGIVHNIKFSRPTQVPIWITANILVDPTHFPSNGVAQTIQNLLDYGAGLVPDYDVFASQLSAAIFSGIPSQDLPGVVGVLDPGLPLIGLSNPPTVSTTIPISSRQIAVFDAGHIVVNVTNGSP